MQKKPRQERDVVAGLENFAAASPVTISLCR